MRKLLKAIAWTLISLAIASALISPLPLIEDEPDKGATFGLLMFAFLFGVPGGILLWRVRTKDKEEAFRAGLLGLIRSHDRFTVEEMARKVGRTEMETEQLIAEIAHGSSLDLLFHRTTREYLHRGRLQGRFEVHDRCPSCGASLPHEVVLENETVSCQYCSAVLSPPGA